MTREEFTKRFNEIAERALSLSGIARQKGILALQECVDAEKCKQRDVFELGLRLLVDGVDHEVIDKILSNIVNTEKDDDAKILKTVQKEAALGIQAGENPSILALLIYSHVDIEIAGIAEEYLT